MDSFSKHAPGDPLDRDTALYRSDAESNNYHPETAVHARRQEVETVRLTEVG